MDPELASQLPQEAQGLISDTQNLAGELGELVERLVLLAVWAVQWLLVTLLWLLRAAVNFLSSLL